MGYVSTSNPIGCVFDNVVQDDTAHVERNVSTRTDELNELLIELLSYHAKETGVRAESDAMKVLLSD